MAEWFQINVNRLAKVNNNEEKKDILTEIKIKLGSCNHAEIEAIARSLDVGSLFLLLLSNDRYDDDVVLIFLTPNLLITRDQFSNIFIQFN